MSRRHLKLPALALALALAASWACSVPDDEELETTQEVVVATEPARQGSIRPGLSATGVVRPAPGGELLVIAPRAARLAEVPAAVGDRVAAGTVLVRFEIPALEAEAAAAAAAVERAAAHVENARLESEREQGLFDRGIAARKEAEDARRELRDAEAELAAARSAATAAATELGRSTVRAPFRSTGSSSGGGTAPATSWRRRTPIPCCGSSTRGGCRSRSPSRSPRRTSPSSARRPASGCRRGRRRSSPG